MHISPLNVKLCDSIFVWELVEYKDDWFDSDDKIDHNIDDDDDDEWEDIRR